MAPLEGANPMFIVNRSVFAVLAPLALLAAVVLVSNWPAEVPARQVDASAVEATEPVRLARASR